VLSETQVAKQNKAGPDRKSVDPCSNRVVLLAAKRRAAMPSFVLAPSYSATTLAGMNSDFWFTAGVIGCGVATVLLAAGLVLW
jgi:hypothetical protein